MKPEVKIFFDEPSSTFSYIVYAGPETHCAIIDPVLGYDSRTGRINTRYADALIEFVRHKSLNVQWILETHAHADHLSAASYLREKLGGRIAISDAIHRVQKIFKNIYNFEDDYCQEQGQFDYFFQPDEIFHIGELTACAMHVPGHTPADIAYVIESCMVFVGDTLFPPDVGTARCDFPGGDASQLYRSIRRLLDMPTQTRLFMCHDYPPAGRNKISQCSVGEQRIANIHVRDGISEAEFIAMRTLRDSRLDMPELLLPSIQINIRAGDLPPVEQNGFHYLKIPIGAF